MDYLSNDNDEKKPLLKRVLSVRTLLFIVAYVIYFGISWVQMNSGEFLLQESGELDSITSYDYVLPIINSVATLVTLVVFAALGFVSYNKDKVKMLRFPMAYSISAVAGSFLSVLFTALCSSPFIDSLETELNIIQVQSYVVVALRFVIALLFYFYFDSEKEKELYYSDDFYVENPAARKTLRERILLSRLCVFWVILIVGEGADLFGELARSGFTAALMAVPDEYLWLSYYIDVVHDVVSYGLQILFAWYFTRELRLSVKLLGLIYLLSHAMSFFSFITNSITNVFAQAGDHMLNSIFSTVFVSIAVFIMSVVRLILIVLVCSKLKKINERDSSY